MNDEFDGLIRFACQLVCQTVILAVGNDVSFSSHVICTSVCCVCYIYALQKSLTVLILLWILFLIQQAYSCNITLYF